jgi:hypothetical protein
MIVADRLALKANIVQGISQNLQLLVDLYSTNLNSCGVQSSVIASIMYASLASTSLKDGYLNDEVRWLSGLYYGLSIVSLTASMSCVILCTIAAVYGPWLALTGESNEVIIKAVLEMKKTQQFVFYMGCFAMVTFLTSVMAYMYSNFQEGVATMVTVMLIFTVFLIATLGMRAMQRIRFKGKKYLDELFKLMQSQHESEAVARDQMTTNRAMAPAVQHAGALWRRRAAHKGGNFVTSYVILKKGCLEIYENKEMYEQGDNMKERVKLQDMRLTVKLKEFHHDYSTFGVMPSFKGLKFVLDHALLFAVIPREDHEVVSSVQVAEFQAMTTESRKEWVKALQTVDTFYDGSRGNAITAILSQR